MFLAAIRAQVWVALDDEDAMADLHEMLAPYADRLTYSTPVGFQGAMRLTLGRLLAGLGRTDEAREQLTISRQVHADLGLPRWVALSEAALAGL